MIKFKFSNLKVAMALPRLVIGTPIIALAPHGYSGWDGLKNHECGLPKDWSVPLLCWSHGRPLRGWSCGARVESPDWACDPAVITHTNVLGPRHAETPTMASPFPAASPCAAAPPRASPALDLDQSNGGGACSAAATPGVGFRV